MERKAFIERLRFLAKGTTIGLAFGIAIIAAAIALLVRGLWLVSDGTVLDVHSGQQFTSHLIDFFASLKSGTIFPQWSVFVRSGFGSPYLGYYQPGFSYIASICLLLTGDPQRAVALATTLFTVIGATGMFAFARRLFRSTDKIQGYETAVAASIATVAFLGHPYLGVNLYERGDYSEYVCAMVVPWVLAIAYADVVDFQSTRQHASRRFWLRGWLGLCPLATALAACVVLHPLLAYPLFVVFLVLPVFARHVPGARRLWPALAAAALLSAFYWLPLLGELHLVALDKAFPPEFQPARHLLSLGRTLFLNSQSPGPFSFQPNWALMAFAGAGIFVAMRRASSFRKVALIATATTAALIWMMTPTSLWIWNWFPLLAKLQFPWRLQNFAAISTAILATVGASELVKQLSLKKTSSRRPWLRAVVTATTVLFVILLLVPFAFTAGKSQPEFQIRTTGDLITSGFTGDLMDEWMPRTATMRTGRPDQAALIAGPCTAGPVQRLPGQIRVAVVRGGAPSHQGSDEKCVVTIPQFYFPIGWRAEVETPNSSHMNERIEILNRDGFMEVALPRPASGLGHDQAREPDQKSDQKSGQTIVLTNIMTPLRRWGVALSAATAIALVGLWICRRRVR